MSAVYHSLSPVKVRVVRYMTAISCCRCIQPPTLERPWLHDAYVDTEQHGINVNCIDYMGRNALHLAVDSENSDCIKLLLDRLSCECQEEVKLLSQISKKVSKCQFVERITFPLLHQLGYLKKSALNFDLTNWQNSAVER